jgi:hypothetical protein
LIDIVCVFIIGISELEEIVELNAYKDEKNDYSKSSGWTTVFALVVAS